MAKAFLYTLIITSFIISLGAGWKTESFDWWSIILGFSTASFGVSMTFWIDSLIAKSDRKDTLAEIKRLFEKANLFIDDTSLISNDVESIKPILGEWHQYNLSKRDGETKWIYAKYNVQADQFGSIRFDVSYPDLSGKDKLYQYTGMVRDSRVIFIGKSKIPNGSNCFVEFFPHLTNDTYKHHVGFYYASDWDGGELIAPAILSRHKLCGEEVDQLLLADFCKEARWANGLVH